MKILSLIFSIFVFIEVSHAEDRIPKEQYYWLTRAIYFEARGEGEIGWRGVSEVIINRINSDRFPSTLRGVINQPHRQGDNTYKCQFSYKCDNIEDVLVPEDYLLFHRISMVAYRALRGEYHYNLTNNATHYIRCDLMEKNGWWSDMEFTVRINSHCYLRRKV